MADEKSIDPTPLRRQQARQAGQVARSQDLCSAVLLLGSLLAMSYAAGPLVQSCTELMTGALGGQAWLHLLDSQALDPASTVSEQWNPLVVGLGGALLPVLALSVICAIVPNLLQSGFLFLPSRLMPDASRVNPWAGLGRILSPASGARLIFGLFKLTVITAVAGACLYHRRAEVAGLAALELPSMAGAIWQLCLSTCTNVALALVGLSIGDYFYERWKFERDLKMTPQELREEMRNLQGDPQLLARRRALQRTLGSQRTAHLVAKADVVLTAQDMIAVALRFSPDQAVPVVIVKGSAVSATRIRAAAREHAVPIVEAPELARSLHDQVAQNRAITAAHYGPVAEVLAGLRVRKSPRV